MRDLQLLLPSAIKTIVLPLVLARLLIAYAVPSLHATLASLAYLLSLPVAYVARVRLQLYQADRHAAQAGVRPILRVQGRLPLNVDVVLDWARSGTEDEVCRMMVELGRTYGKTYNTRALGEDQIITTDPKVMRHVLVDEHTNFVKGDKFRQRSKGFLGDGIFSSDGDRWRFHRNLSRPFFHPRHISSELLAPLIREFLENIPLDGSAFDMQERLGDLALQISLKWLAGAEATKQEMRALGEALVEAEHVVGRRMKIGTVWPLFELGGDLLEKPMKTIRSILDPLIDRALQAKRRRKSTLGNQEDTQLRLLDQWVDSVDDRKLIEDQLNNMLFAARDTTAALLTFCVYCLTLYPAEAVKCREEALSYGDDDADWKGSKRDSKYTRCFINEVLRLFPPIPLNIRRSVQPTLLPGETGEPPMQMPAHTAIILVPLLMHRDKDLWGPDAMAFRPERWSDIGNREREGFMPWNAGPRMCLGQPLALTAAHIFLTLYLQHLDRLDPSGNLTACLATDAQPVEARMPAAWASPERQQGDGRAREGRDKVWFIADVVLAIKGGLWLRFDSEADNDLYSIHTS